MTDVNREKVLKIILSLIIILLLIGVSWKKLSVDSIS